MFERIHLQLKYSGWDDGTEKRGSRHCLLKGPASLQARKRHKNSPPGITDMDKLSVISGCLFLAADICAIASVANPDWISTGDSAGGLILTFNWTCFLMLGFSCVRGNKELVIWSLGALQNRNEMCRRILY